MTFFPIFSIKTASGQHPNNIYPPTAISHCLNPPPDRFTGNSMLHNQISKLSNFGIALQYLKMELVILGNQQPSNSHGQAPRPSNNNPYLAVQSRPNPKQDKQNLHPSDDLQVRERPLFQVLEIRDYASDEENKGKKQAFNPQTGQEGRVNKHQHVGQQQLSDSHNYLISPEKQQPRYIQSSDVVVEVSPRKTKQTIKTNPAEPLEESELEPIATASQESSECVNRFIGIFILLGMFGVLWIYGWASQYRIVLSTSTPVNLTLQPFFSSLFIISAIFTVIGFGLLFMHFKKMSESAIFTSLFITSLTIISSPFIQKFWYNIFMTDFSNSSIATANTSYLLNQSLGGKNISIDFYNLKFSLINAISQLVVLLGLFGKLNALQTTFFSLLYNVAWSLSHYLIVSRQNSSPDSRIFDDYQISSVYLFAGMFGIFSSLILKKPPSSIQGFTHSNFSSMLAQIGTFFLFLSFCANSILFSQKSNSYSSVRTYVWQQAFINTFFAMAASVICTYLGSILFGEKIHVRQSVLGTITGAITFGSVAYLCTNIGAALACGGFSGLHSAFFYHKVYTKINRQRIFDSLGVTLIAVTSIIATLGIAPLVIYAYYYYGITVPTLPNDAGTTNTTITTSSIVGYVLEYVGITAGIGASSGVVVGVLLKIFDRFDADKLFDDKSFVGKNSGLKPEKDKSQSRMQSKSNQNKKYLRPERNLEGVQSQKEMVAG